MPHALRDFCTDFGIVVRNGVGFISRDRAFVELLIYKSIPMPQFCPKLISKNIFRASHLKLRCKSPNFVLKFSILILNSSHTEMKAVTEIKSEISMIHELFKRPPPPAVFKTQFVQFHTKKPEQSNHHTCSGFSLVIIIIFVASFFF